MIVADTSAFVAALNGEVDAEAILDRASYADPVYVSAATAVELGIVVFARFGEEGLGRMEALMRTMRVETRDVDRRQSIIAIEAYKRFGCDTGHPARLNFGDCFAYALAKALDLPLLFKGDDFVYTDVRPAMAE